MAGLLIYAGFSTQATLASKQKAVLITDASTYSGSKHWMEAFTDSLAGEMAQHGVGVSLIEPGSYKSKIRRTTAARIASNIEAVDGTRSFAARTRRGFRCRDACSVLRRTATPLHGRAGPVRG